MKVVKSDSYDEYKQEQVKANKRKFENVWASEKELDMVVDAVSDVEFGVCHGARNGAEVRYLRKKLGCEVVGTDISPTVRDVEHCIEWDMHEVKDDWIGEADFVYSNSIDHSYDPEKALRAWYTTLKDGGRCFVEWHVHKKGNKCDCLLVTVEELRDLMTKVGFKDVGIANVPQCKQLEGKRVIGDGANRRMVIGAK